MDKDTAELIIGKFQRLLDETFSNPFGFYLQKDAAYSATLAGIDQQLASRINPATKESIAGHVAHVLLSLRYLQDYLSSKDTGHYDWKKDWNTVVDDAQWAAMQQDLMREYGRMKDFITGFTRWFEGQNLEILIGTIAHCALHLGMIRQIKDF